MYLMEMCLEKMCLETLTLRHSYCSEVWVVVMVGADTAVELMTRLVQAVTMTVKCVLVASAKIMLSIGTQGSSLVLLLARLLLALLLLARLLLALLLLALLLLALLLLALLLLLLKRGCLLLLLLIR